MFTTAFVPIPHDLLPCVWTYNLYCSLFIFAIPFARETQPLRSHHDRARLIPPRHASFFQPCGLGRRGVWARYCAWVPVFLGGSVRVPALLKTGSLSQSPWGFLCRTLPDPSASVCVCTAVWTAITSGNDIHTCVPRQIILPKFVWVKSSCKTVSHLPRGRANRSQALLVCVRVILFPCSFWIQPYGLGLQVGGAHYCASALVFLGGSGSVPVLPRKGSLSQFPWEFLCRIFPSPSASMRTCAYTLITRPIFCGNDNHTCIL